MRRFAVLLALGVAAATLLLVTPATSQAHGGHGHAGHGHGHVSYHHYHHGYYGRGYYHRGWYGWRRCARYPYWVPPACSWTQYQTIQWVQDATDPSYYGLFVDGVQVAGFNAKTGDYRTYDAATDTWSVPLSPPKVEGL
jgi:hypothetical protein